MSDFEAVVRVIAGAVDYGPFIGEVDGFHGRARRDGDVEWQKDEDGVDEGGVPAPRGRVRPLAFAGLYELWRDRRVAEDGDPGAWVMASKVLTRPATDALGHIHDRRPVISRPRCWPSGSTRRWPTKSAIADFIDAIPSLTAYGNR